MAATSQNIRCATDRPQTIVFRQSGSVECGWKFGNIGTPCASLGHFLRGCQVVADQANVAPEGSLTNPFQRRNSVVFILLALDQKLLNLFLGSIQRQLFGAHEITHKPGTVGVLALTRCVVFKRHQRCAGTKVIFGPGTFEIFPQGS